MRRRESSGGGIERDVPPVVPQRHEREARLAHDLGPQVQGVLGRLPLLEGKWRQRIHAGGGCATGGHVVLGFDSVATLRRISVARTWMARVSSEFILSSRSSSMKSWSAFAC